MAHQASSMLWYICSYHNIILFTVQQRCSSILSMPNHLHSSRRASII